MIFGLFGLQHDQWQRNMIFGQDSISTLMHLGVNPSLSKGIVHSLMSLGEFIALRLACDHWWCPHNSGKIHIRIAWNTSDIKIHVMIGTDYQQMAPIGISKAEKFLWVCQFSPSYTTISLFQLNFERIVLDHFYNILSFQSQDGRIGWRRGVTLFCSMVSTWHCNI